MDATEQLIELRNKAKDLRIPNHHNMGYEKLYPKVMEAQDKIADKVKSEELSLRTKTEKEELERKKQGSFGNEKYYFTNEKTGKIGEYILTDQKNMLPHTQKGTAFKFVRWM